MRHTGPSKVGTETILQPCRMGIGQALHHLQAQPDGQVTALPCQLHFQPQRSIGQR